jgi:hypothetical protein
MPTVWLHSAAHLLHFLHFGARDDEPQSLWGRLNKQTNDGEIVMKTALRTLALAGLVGFAVLAGNVGTAKAQNVYGNYGASYPSPYAYGNSGYYPGYYSGYYPYAYATPGVYVGNYWGPGRGYWRNGYSGRGYRGYYWGRGHWRR